MFSNDAFIKYAHNKNKFLNKTDEKSKSFVYLKFGFEKENKEKKIESFKSEISKDKFYSIGNKEKIQNMSGIFSSVEKADEYVKNLTPYSFIIWAKFELKQPYFSRDDDEFYIISNSILKEKAFKIPMIRGSGWKGSLARSFKELMNDSFGEIGGSNILNLIDSYFRIFGDGSEYVKNLEDYLSKKLENKNRNLDELKDTLFKLLLFELGIQLSSERIKKIKEARDEEEVFKIFRKEYYSKIEEMKTRKGRAIFYPTYFDKLSLEVINPHSRKTRAGTKPIHYEVVPEGTEGILQIVYIPFDGVLRKDNIIEGETKKDLENLLLALEKLSEVGIGAKTKLGWGTFEFQERFYCTNEGLKMEHEGWSKCQI